MEQITSWQALSEADRKEFVRLCTPLVEFLQKKCTPHTWIIVEWDRASLTQDRLSVPFKVPD